MDLTLQAAHALRGAPAHTCPHTLVALRTGCRFCLCLLGPYHGRHWHCHLNSLGCNIGTTCELVVHMGHRGGEARQFKCCTGVYERLMLASSSEKELEIVRDLSRTYPSHVYYQQRQGPGQRSLFNVLRAYSVYDRQVSGPPFQPRPGPGVRPEWSEPGFNVSRRVALDMCTRGNQDGGLQCKVQQAAGMSGCRACNPLLGRSFRTGGSRCRPARAMESANHLL